MTRRRGLDGWLIGLALTGPLLLWHPLAWVAGLVVVGAWMFRPTDDDL